MACSTETDRSSSSIAAFGERPATERAPSSVHSVPAAVPASIPRPRLRPGGFYLGRKDREEPPASGQTRHRQALYGQTSYGQTSHRQTRKENRAGFNSE